MRVHVSGTTYGIDEKKMYREIKVGDEIRSADGKNRYKVTAIMKETEKVIAKEGGEGKKKEIDDIERLREFFGGDDGKWEKVICDATLEEIDKKGKKIAGTEQDEMSIHWYRNNESGNVDYKAKEKQK